ncbi:uncharacterized protein LOC143887506 isoform X2 [Tasmannia lanceolata]|uniref:uncharacterized protein LOC143887506 isoform X2 n=1 Tax=Tasmannia lanceolata TaxID=3420 RepID=UPI00406431B6
MIEVSSSVAFALHLLCACSLSVAFWITRVVYVSSLISNPVQTLRLLWVIQSPIVILGFSLVRQNPQHCSYLKAVGRGLLGLLAGSFQLGAILQALRDETMNDPRDRIEMAHSHASICHHF